MLENKTILVGVSGSIAAYKAAALCSLLVKKKADVHVVMTKNATEFVAPLTFSTLTGNKTVVDMFDTDFEYDVEHISLAKKCDLAIIAPASANVIAKIAHGLADDMLTTTLLATKAPICIAPAMNTAMYENIATVENINILKNRGYHIIEPGVGVLACKDVGKGKMAEPDDILDNIEICIGREKELAGKKVLISAGPTTEPIDPVRFISNHSTGKMGYALAFEAAMMGADVTLISGRVNLTPPPGVMVKNVLSAEDMYQAVIKEASGADIIIMSAAVADFTPLSSSASKIKKSDMDELSLPLKKTKDILKELGETVRPDQFICGFSMETENLVENSKKKLASKNCNMIVANNLNDQGAGFATETNIVTIITKDGDIKLPLASKRDIAYAILEKIKKIIF